MTTIRVSSGVTSGVTIFPNNTISVYSSGSTLDIVLSGGTEVVSDGGVSSSTHILKGGTENILKSGTSYHDFVEYQGRLFVSSGGLAISSTIYNGAILLVESGGKTSKTIDVDGIDWVYSDGTAFDTTIKGGVQELIGGKSVDTTLIVTKGRGYSVQFVDIGGVARGTNIGVGATQYIAEGDKTSGTEKAIAYNTRDSGTESVSSSGVTSGTEIFGGGTEYVYSAGASYGTKVSGGTEYVSSSGVAIGTTVYNGGSEIVASAGVTSRTTISGGKLEIEKGGIARGLITFAGSGGELVIDSKSMSTATIEGFAATDSIVLSAIPYSTSDSVTVNAANLVTISAGGKTYNLHIAGATIGETDFTFGPGSILTKTATPKMALLRPPAAGPSGINAADFSAPPPVMFPKIQGGVETITSPARPGAHHLETPTPTLIFPPLSITQSL